MSSPKFPRGRLIAVVGPSGVGKDSVLTGLAAQDPGLQLLRREITRAPELGGEDYTPVTEAQFEASVAQGSFCLHWRAHGLGYGIPNDVLTRAQAGQDALVNLSRNVLVEAARRFPRLIVINLFVAPEVLAERIKGRARESAADIAKRLARKVRDFDPSLEVHHIANDGALEDTISAVLQVLRRDPAPVGQP